MRLTRAGRAVLSASPMAHSQSCNEAVRRRSRGRERRRNRGAARGRRRRRSRSDHDARLGAVARLFASPRRAPSSASPCPSRPMRKSKASCMASREGARRRASPAAPRSSRPTAQFEPELSRAPSESRSRAGMAPVPAVCARARRRRLSRAGHDERLGRVHVFPLFSARVASPVSPRPSRHSRESSPSPRRVGACVGGNEEARVRITRKSGRPDHDARLAAGARFTQVLDAAAASRRARGFAGHDAAVAHVRRGS